MRTLATALSLHKSASRRLGAAAVILIASALLHVVVLLAVSGQWAGPVSLRKPITFGLSMGMLLWTLGWVIDRLPSKPRLERLLGTTLAASGLIEVGLISVQAWRGVPSHFNYTTTADLLIFVAMGISIAFLSVCLVVTTVWAFRRPPAHPTVRLAVRAGLLLSLSGLGIGQWMIDLGNDVFERTDNVPEQLTAGAAGMPAVAHAMGFHGIQVFIVAALVVGLLGLEAAMAQRVVRLAVAGYSVLVLWTIVQAGAGLAPLEIFWPGGALAGIGIGLLAAAAAQLFNGWRHTQTSWASDELRETAVPSAL